MGGLGFLIASRSALLGVQFVLRFFFFFFTVDEHLARPFLHSPSILLFSFPLSLFSRSYSRSCWIVHRHGEVFFENTTYTVKQTHRTASSGIERHTRMDGCMGDSFTIYVYFLVSVVPISSGS